MLTKSGLSTSAVDVLQSTQYDHACPFLPRGNVGSRSTGTVLDKTHVILPTHKLCLKREAVRNSISDTILKDAGLVNKIVPETERPYHMQQEGFNFSSLDSGSTA
eukprot:369555-Amphidinium_carterae.1